MSTDFSKNKKKRRRTTSDESNTSFVKNVTSRVLGLLPSTITEWFRTPSSSSANSSAPPGDATDSSTEDEALERPVVITEPPAKRMRFGTPVRYEHFVPVDAACSVSNIEAQEPICNTYNSTPFPTRSVPKTQLTSASEETLKENSDSTVIKTPPHTMSSVGRTVASKRKSIFNTHETEESTSARAKAHRNTSYDRHQPSFKASLLGSPFYRGTTMYGGASSSYINQPNIKQQTVAYVNQSNSKVDSGMSSSTKRILDLLEQYSSPLIDAKRILPYTRNKNDSFNNTLERSLPYSTKQSYKDQELHVASIGSILRLKQKSRLMETTSAARQIIASHSSTIDSPTYPVSKSWQAPEQSQVTTKIKSRLAKPSREKQNDNVLLTPVKLPTASLPIDQEKLKKISFGMPVSMSNATSTPKVITNNSTAKTNSTEVLSSKHEKVVTNNFKFSNPVKVSCDSAENGITPPKFKFDSPERRIEEKPADTTDDVSVCVAGNLKTPEKTIVKSNDWKCSDCWVSNKMEVDKCVCCGGKRPSKSAVKPAKCIVCKLADCQPPKDKCVGCEKTQNSIPIISNSSKWKCEDCWVSNEDTSEKCACCGARKPKKSDAATPVQTSIAPVAENPENDWRCGGCWIINKNSVNNCVACGGAKPGAKQAKVTPTTATIPVPASAPAPAPAPNIGSSFFKPSTDSFQNIVKSQKEETWECPYCLVRNNVTKSLCVCCGAEKDKKTTIPEKKFNFGVNTSFKFGIDLTAQEAKINEKPVTETPPLAPVKEQSEKNNNILNETPTFNFTLPVKKPEQKSEPSKAKLDETPKPAFTFGIPKSPPTPVVPAKPPSPVKNVQKEQEKPQEIPKTNLISPIQEQTKPLGGLFSLPLSKPVTNSTSMVSAPTFSAPTLVEVTKDSTSVPITLKPATTDVEKPKLMNTFSFSSKPISQNLFTTPTTTVASTNLFAPPSQTTIPTTTAPTLLFKPPETSVPSLAAFQKPAPTTTATPSLFQNSVTNTTAAPSAVSTAPVFSFGSNATSSTTTAEKPAFFAFGNTAPKTESAPPSMFASSSPFGGATETNASNNNNSFGVSSNVWSSNPPASSTNMFVSNTTTDSPRKTATFTFGSSPFNATSSTAPAFGNTQPTQNIFGMNQNNNQPSMFSTPVASQPASIFGSPQAPAANPAPQMGLFGSSSVSATPAFAAPNPTIPSFDAPSLTPAPAPAFNFGGQQQPVRVFGFGQQQQPQQAGVYNFGGAPAAASPVQFTMGSGANTAGRRVRKAVRRNPPR